MTVPARTSTATRKRPRKVSEDSDLEILEHDEEAGTIRARLFGSEFTFADNIHPLLLLEISDDDRGGSKAILDILKSIVLVEDDTDEARATEWERFRQALLSERKMSVERLMRIVNDIAEVAGKDQADSSGN